MRALNVLFSVKKLRPKYEILSQNFCFSYDYKDQKQKNRVLGDENNMEKRDDRIIFDLILECRG